MEGEHGLVRMMLSGPLLPTRALRLSLEPCSQFYNVARRPWGVLIKYSSLFALPIPGRSETMDGQEPMHMALFLLVPIIIIIPIIKVNFKVRHRQR